MGGGDSFSRRRFIFKCILIVTGNYFTIHHPFPLTLYQLIARLNRFAIYFIVLIFTWRIDCTIDCTSGDWRFLAFENTTMIPDLMM